MAATNQALIGQYSGGSVQLAFSGNESRADILQINSSAGVLVSVDYTGAVHFNSSGLTPTDGAGGSGLYTSQGAVVGVFPITTPSFNIVLNPPSSVAQAFMLAFPNNTSGLDIIQIRQVGGNISYWLDSSGVAHGS